MEISYKLDNFEGPLDLLLHLIEKNKVSIYDIPIVLITEQYLEYVNQMDHEDLDVVSDFLVMAATLLDIKSRMLLPKVEKEEEEDEEDPRAELVRRLLEYKMYKYMAQELEERAAAAKQRAAANSRRLSARRAAANTDLSGADEKLLAALYALRKRLAAKQNVPAYMVFSDATLREMVQSKPLSMDEFLNITGVGEKKAARYGMAFLRVIEEMVNSR